MKGPGLWACPTDSYVSLPCCTWRIQLHGWMLLNDMVSQDYNIIPALGRYRQEDQEFKASLIYIASLRLVCMDYMKPGLQWMVFHLKEAGHGILAISYHAASFKASTMIQANVTEANSGWQEGPCPRKQWKVLPLKNPCRDWTKPIQH